MNNTLGDWSIIVNDDKLNKNLETIDMLETKIDKLSDKFTKIIIKLDSLDIKLDSLDIKLDSLKSKIDEDDDDEEDKLIEGDDEEDEKTSNSNNSNNSNNSVGVNKTSLYPFSFNTLGLKGLIDDNNRDRIQNTLWRKNIINFNPNNCYTTTPNIKY